MKVLLTVVFLAIGVAAGLWLALGANTPQGVAQSWDQVKASAEQLWANADTKLHEAGAPAYQGGPAGPNLLERITAPFEGFAKGVQGLWAGMSRGIRPPSP